VIYITTFKEHVEHLERFFTRLDAYNFSIPHTRHSSDTNTVKLLGQRIDAFRYASTTKRMAALTQLALPPTAAELETYCSIV
jgi:hypothetical protein